MKKIKKIALTIPQVKRIVKKFRKPAKEANKKKDSTINFNSKTPASKTPTANAAVFGTGSQI